MSYLGVGVEASAGKAKVSYQLGGGWAALALVRLRSFSLSHGLLSYNCGGLVLAWLAVVAGWLVACFWLVLTKG